MSTCKDKREYTFHIVRTVPEAIKWLDRKDSDMWHVQSYTGSLSVRGNCFTWRNHASIGDVIVRSPKGEFGFYAMETFNQVFEVTNAT